MATLFHKIFWISLVIGSLLFLASCRRNIELTDLFDIKGNDLNDYYSLYYKDENVLSNYKCLKFNFSDSIIIVEMERIIGGSKAYFIVNTIVFKNGYGKIENKGITLPLNRDDFETKLKEMNIDLTLDYSVK